MGLERTIHLNVDAHPRDLTPRRAGHSIGRWDGDTLVVDTIGFEPGILLADGRVPHSGQMHVIERFTLEGEGRTLRRSFVATDPLYSRANTVAGTRYTWPTCRISRSPATISRTRRRTRDRAGRGCRRGSSSASQPSVSPPASSCGVVAGHTLQRRMQTITDLGAAAGATTRAAIRGRTRSRFYVGLGAFMSASWSPGSGRRTLGRCCSGRVARPAVIQVHGIVFVGWMALLMTQVVLAARGRMHLHRRIGRYGIAYGWLVVAAVWCVGPAASVIHVRAGEWTRDRGAGFLLTTFGDMVLFGGLLCRGGGVSASSRDPQAPDDCGDGGAALRRRRPDEFITRRRSPRSCGCRRSSRYGTRLDHQPAHSRRYIVATVVLFIGATRILFEQSDSGSASAGRSSTRCCSGQGLQVCLRGLVRGDDGAHGHPADQHEVGQHPGQRSARPGQQRRGDHRHQAAAEDGAELTPQRHTRQPQLRIGEPLRVEAAADRERHRLQNRTGDRHREDDDAGRRGGGAERTKRT